MNRARREQLQEMFPGTPLPEAALRYFDNLKDDKPKKKTPKKSAPKKKGARNAKG